MAQVISGEFNFLEWERETEPRTKVRKASSWIEEVYALSVGPQGRTGPDMRSTKLRGDLEFRPAEVTVWAGYNGHRKSIFTSQVALDLCTAGERVLMASFEMLPIRTLHRMNRQAHAARWPSAAQIESFARWSDTRLWIFDHLGRLKPAVCMAVLKYFAEELHGQHVFIDSMQFVCESEERLDEQKQFMTDLVRIAQETGLHVHLVAHCRKPQDDVRPPTKYDLRGSAALSDQAHNVVTIWANKPKERLLEKDPSDLSAQEQPDALVTVEKQRNGEWEGSAKLWFDRRSMRFCDERIAPVEPYELG